MEVDLRQNIRTEAFGKVFGANVFLRTHFHVIRITRVYDMMQSCCAKTATKMLRKDNHDSTIV